MDNECENLSDVYTSPYWRGFVDKHRKNCEECTKKWAPFFEHLDGYLQSAIDDFNTTRGSFVRTAKAAGYEGEHLDGGSSFAAALCEQVGAEFMIYSRTADPFSAAAWLTKAFWACRAVDSQALVDKKDAEFLARKKKLGMVENHRVQRIEPEPRTFGEETSLRGMRTHHADQLSMPFNYELWAEVNALIDRDGFVQALTLLCDPSKHGTQSGILNLVAVMHAEQIYTLGLSAVAQALHAVAPHVTPAAK